MYDLLHKNALYLSILKCVILEHSNKNTIIYLLWTQMITSGYLRQHRWLDYQFFSCAII
jgi:hypothetical protein